MDTSPGTVSDILSGRNYGDEEKRRKAADFLGIDYEMMLKFGRHISKGGDPGQWLAQMNIKSMTISGSSNLQIGGDLHGNGSGKIEIQGQKTIPYLQELVELLSECASPLEIKKLTEKYRQVKEDLENGANN